MFNIATGEDDDHPLGGDIGEQAAAPFNPMPPPPGQAPGPEVIPPAPMPAVAAPPAAVMPSSAPQLPQVAPYQPQAPAPVPTSRVVTPAEAANLGAIDQNTQARMTTAQDAGNVRGAGATARDQATEREQFLADAKRQEIQRIQDDAAKRIQDRTAQANADYEQYKKFGIKDPEASDNFATRIMKAIVVGLGGYASGINGGPNQALQIITEANKENIARQKAQQEKLFQISQRSGKDVEQAKIDRDDAFKQLDLKHSALLESSAAMLRSELGRLGIPQAQIDTNKDVQAVEKEALGLREKTLADIRDDETSLARADTAAASRRHKAAGAGGGGGGSNLQRFADAAGQLPKGAPIPGDLVALGVRAGLKPNQVAAEVDRYRNSGGKSDNAGLPGDRLVSKEAQQWAQQNGLTAISKQQRELSALQKELADNPHNPLLQALAVEKAVSAARGGAASKQALALALEHLGGSLDNADAFISKVKSGEIGPKQMENFTGFINGQLGTAQKEGREAYDNFNKFVEATPDTGTKAKLLQERGRLFSGMHGFAGSDEGAPAKAPKREGGAGKTLEIKTATDKALAASARRLKPGDPNYDSAQTWLRAHGE